jgi:hypothetical protein
MLELYEQIEEAVGAIRDQWPGRPHAGIILGTGLGGLADEIDVEASFDYETIPHFPRSTASPSWPWRGGCTCMRDTRSSRSRCRCGS